MRIHDATHKALGRVAEWYRVSRRVLIDALVVALLADWYGRDIPHVYDALMLDRLHALHARMADEFAGRKLKSDFRTAVKEALGIDLPAGFAIEGGDQSGTRGRSSRGRGIRASRTRKRAGDKS